MVSRVLVRFLGRSHGVEAAVKAVQVARTEPSVRVGKVGQFVKAARAVIAVEDVNVVIDGPVVEVVMAEKLQEAQLVSEGPTSLCFDLPEERLAALVRTESYKCSTQLIERENHHPHKGRLGYRWGVGENTVVMGFQARPLAVHGLAEDIWAENFEAVGSCPDIQEDSRGEDMPFLGEEDNDVPNGLGGWLDGCGLG